MRMLFGLRGDIDEQWSWDAFISRAHMEDTQLSTGQINVSNFREALNVIDGECASEAARLEGCVPVNLFGVGSISPKAASYLSAPALRDQETEQTNLGFSITGTVASLPAGPLAIAAGYEYRDEFAADTPDALTQSGQNGGNASAPTRGDFDVNEFFLELDIPLLSDAPLAKELSAGAAYRYSDYNTVGDTEAFTGRISWSITDDLRVRTQYARAVRAPNINELFAPGGENFAPVSDPCNNVNATTPGVVAENCRSIPAIAERIAAVGEFVLTQPEIQGTGGFTSRGNGNLSPEKSDSFTVGIVYDKQFDGIGSLTLSADWYEIEVENLIDTVGRQTSVDFCYNQSSFPNAFCGFIERDATGPAFQLGEITAVNSGFINEGTLETSGIDLQAEWAMALGDYSSALRGDLRFGVNYGYLEDYTLTKFGDEDKQNGEIGLPDHKALFTALYAIDNFTFQWQTTYLSDSKVDNNIDIFNFKVGDFTVHDIFASYSVTDSFRISAGVDNLLGEDAPVILTGVQGNTTGWDTDASVYGAGAIGRSYYVMLDLQF